jgi:TfoX/Sxy family transcriptional regulator of competence genes
MPTDPQHTFDRLTEQFLTNPHVQPGRMFGATVLTLGGKVFAMLVNDDLVVKLPAGEAGDLVDAGVATFFDPGHGRPMKQWIAVPATHAPRWRRLAEQARDHAAQG